MGVVAEIKDWSVTKHGVSLFHNVDPSQGFLDGCSLDVEDDESGNFVGIGIYAPERNSCYYWSDWELAKQLTIPKFIAHHGRTDLAKLQKWGFKVDEAWLMWDTQLIEHILDSSKKTYGLKHLVKAYFEQEYPSYEEMTGKKKSKSHVTLDKLPVDLVSQYNGCDTYYTYKLYLRQLEMTHAQ